MVRVLAHVYSTSYFMSALAAVRELHPGGEARITMVLHLPGASPQRHAEMASILRNFSAGIPEIERALACTPEELSGLCTRWSAARSARNLAAFLGGGFDEIFYQHDTSGVFYQLAATAWPKARRVCIGDAFGMVYEPSFLRSYFESQGAVGFSGAARRVARRIRRFLQGGWEAHDFPDFPAELAVLVLPVDPSGVFLKKVPLRVCGRGVFVDVVRHCVAAAPDLARYISDTLAAHAGRARYLLVSEHYAEAGQLPLDREVEMYCAIINRHCEPGSIIYVKRHPSERFPKVERIQERLAGRNEVVVLNGQMMRYPIEIWDRLVRECRVICMAYPVLSLKYIYGVDVIQPMDDSFIEQWFEPRQWSWTKDSLALYTEPARRLATWDGRSVLWSPAMTG